MRTMTHTCWLGLWLVCSGLLLGPVASHGATPAEEQQARSTAVALNYCRASFHRLRNNPSKRVLYEEQQHILNNLNLNGIADQEVVTLYSSVLDEIGRERIAEKEKIVLSKSYKAAVRRQVLSTAFIVGSQITTMQYFNAVRSGANSWWDYRTTTLNHDLDQWKVEKTRMLEVVDKSSKFLDTFWKMAQKKNIPDHWLVRGDDLDRLETALGEQNLETRLRVLQRMERFMTCYPPYWYHLARTQQSLGQLVPATDTYKQLALLGEGHFRKDDMLAAGLANQAVIEAYLQNPQAPRTAQRALTYSTGVWQANLVCAQILQQAGDSLAAEEAILRNLDVDLERTQSLTSLVALYRSSGETQKLAKYLADPETIDELPAVLLLQAAAQLGVRKLPPLAFQQLVTSLYAYEQPLYGRPQVICVASPTWGLEGAETTLVAQSPVVPQSRGLSGAGQTQLVFPTSRVATYSPDGEPELVLDVRYDSAEPIRLHLRRMTWTPEMVEHLEFLLVRNQEQRENWPRLPSNLATQRRRASYVITHVEFQKREIALWNPAADNPLPDSPVIVDQKQKLPGRKAPSNPVSIESVTPLPVEAPTEKDVAPGKKGPPSFPSDQDEDFKTKPTLPLFRGANPVAISQEIEPE